MRQVIERKHTPGPWRMGTFVNGEIVVGAEHRWTKPLIRNIENESDARLIAAAPQLLEALCNLLDMVTDNRTHGPEVYAAANAISKAEGRGQ